MGVILGFGNSRNRGRVGVGVGVRVGVEGGVRVGVRIGVRVGVEGGTFLLHFQFFSL